MQKAMPDEKKEDFVLIARIRKPHGVKGELSLETYTMDDRRFRKLSRVYLRDAKGAVSEHAVASARLTANGVLLKLKGVEDRNLAETLRNQEVLIPESERPALPEGQAYFDQIIGMSVVDDASGATIGRVRDVLEMPAGEVFVLDLDGTEHLVSNAGDEVVSLSVSKNELRVRLLEEYGS